MPTRPSIPSETLAAVALEALDEATRAIAEVVDLETTLQLIVDRVRDLVDAEYAALGIAAPDGAIERFITSGISEEQRATIGPLPRGHGLLGLIIHEGLSVRTPSIGDHPSSFGFPPHHPPMATFLGVPITRDGRPIGDLYLTDKRGGDPSDPRTSASWSCSLDTPPSRWITRDCMTGSPPWPSSRNASGSGASSTTASSSGSMRSACRSRTSANSPSRTRPRSRSASIARSRHCRRPSSTSAISSWAFGRAS